MQSTLLRLGQIAARGDNIERFLMGRQVVAISINFVQVYSRSLLSASCSLPPSWQQSTGEHLMAFSSQCQKLYRFEKPEESCQSSIPRPCCWRPASWPALWLWSWPSSLLRLLQVSTRWDLKEGFSNTPPYITDKIKALQTNTLVGF